MISLSDHQLIKRIKSGDTTCLDILIRRYSDMVRSIVRKSFLTGGEQEDLFQEGLVAIINAVNKYDDKKNSSFSTFVYSSIKSRIIDSIRTATRNKHKPLNEAASLSDENISSFNQSEQTKNPLELYLEKEWIGAFHKRLEQNLTPEQNQIIKLYFAGYSYNEIASKLGVTAKKIDNSLFTIKNKLKKEKDRFDINS